MLKYTFLTQEFYNDYPHSKYPQLEQKGNRPYAHVHISLYGVLFCIPLRSNIAHPYAFFTNRKNKCGLDYSKSVVIIKDSYIDKTTKVHIRKNEFDRLRGKDRIIINQFENYIKLYKQAKFDKTLNHRGDILAFSSLQYFEEYIYPNDTETTADFEYDK